MKDLSIKEEFLKIRINTFLREKKLLKNIIEEYIKDESFSIENRWDMLIFSQFLNEQSTPDLEEIDFYISEENETKKIENIKKILSSILL